VKLQGRAIDGFIARPDPRIRAVLVYGPDAGLVRERAEAVARTVVPDLADPFRVAELPARVVAGDAARLLDEVGALSLVGGRRLIRLREADETVTTACAALFAAAPSGDSLVVLEAGDLNARSRLRVLFEAATIGAALPCYVEDESALRRVIVEVSAGQGLSLDADAQAYLAANLVGDRAVVRGEIEKLALYMGAERRVGLEQVQAVVGDGASLLSLDDPVWAAAAGDFAALDKAMARLYGESTAPVAILRTAQRHFQRLHWVQAEVAAGASIEGAVGALKPPLFFKLRTAFVAQLRQWPLPALRQALERLTDAEIECKRTNMPDETLCARTLLQLAAQARSRR
jgi:DNA polymerase-3 subunit delta